jgi:predicted transposase YdaD
MPCISQFFEQENDVLFQRGELRGEQKANEQLIKNLLTKTTLTPNQTAETAEVSIELVQKIAGQLT